MLTMISDFFARTRKAWGAALGVAVATFVVQMFGVTDPEAVRAVHSLVGAVLDVMSGAVPAIAGAVLAYALPNKA